MIRLQASDASEGKGSSTPAIYQTLRSNVFAQTCDPNDLEAQRRNLQSEYYVVS